MGIERSVQRRRDVANGDVVKGEWLDSGSFSEPHSLLPFPYSRDKLSVFNHLLLINIIKSFIISELTRVQCYWGKKLLGLQITVF